MNGTHVFLFKSASLMVIMILQACKPYGHHETAGKVLKSDAYPGSVVKACWSTQVYKAFGGLSGTIGADFSRQRMNRASNIMVSMIPMQ